MNTTLQAIKNLLKPRCFISGVRVCLGSLHNYLDIHNNHGELIAWITHKPEESTIALNTRPHNQIHTTITHYQLADPDQIHTTITHHQLADPNLIHNLTIAILTPHTPNIITGKNSGITH